MPGGTWPDDGLETGIMGGFAYGMSVDKTFFASRLVLASHSCKPPELIRGSRYRCSQEPWFSLATAGGSGP